MSKGNNIVHNYFSKQIPGGKILVKVNPIHNKAVEIFVPLTGKPEFSEIEINDTAIEYLKNEGFIESNPLEFNLYFVGLV